MKKGLLALLLSLPLLALATEAGEQINTSIHSNEYILAYIAQLAPMAVNPYLTVFLTSLFSNLGWENALVTTNPYLGNYWVLGLTGTLVLLTSLPKILGDKLAGPLTITINYLDSKAAVLINLLILVVPVLFNPSPALNESAVQTMGIDLDIRTAILIFVSVYYLIVVMTVRFFIETMIFLSPFPLVDSAFEILKIGLTIGLTVLAFAFPYVAFAIAVFSFLISLLFYQRAKRSLQRMKYLFLDPMLHFIIRRKAEQVNEKGTRLVDGSPEILIPVITSKTVGGIKKSKKVFLCVLDNENSLIQARSFRKPVSELLNSNFIFKQKVFYTSVSDEQGEVFRINRSYRKFIPEIAKAMGAEFEANNKKSWKGISLFKSVRSDLDALGDALES